MHAVLRRAVSQNLIKSCTASHRTFTLGVRNVLLFGGNVYAEGEIHRASVNREQLFSCLRICVKNIKSWEDFNKILRILYFIESISENYTVLTTRY